MKLEQTLKLYQEKSFDKNIVYFTAGDLSGLSATVLYTGDLPPMTSAGCFDPTLRKRDYIDWDSPSGYASASSPSEFKPIGTVSEFKPATNSGLGPGIAKESEGFIERYRAGKHEQFGGDHVNLEYISPITKKPLINIHIGMKDE